MALFTIAVPPLPGRRVASRFVTGRHDLVKAATLNLALNGAPLLVFWLTVIFWVNIARQTGHLAFEADEAMGIGITFMLCAAVKLVASLGVPLLLWIWALLQRKGFIARNKRPSL